MIPAPRSAWARTTSPKAQELATISHRPAFLRPGEPRRGVIGNCRSPASGDESSVDAILLAPGFRSRLERIPKLHHHFLPSTAGEVSASYVDRGAMRVRYCAHDPR